MPKDTILLAGDSWGVGVFASLQPDQPAKRNKLLTHVIHGGLQQLLEEHDQNVVNLSKISGSNIETTKFITSYLTNNPKLAEQVKAVIVFQTEWCRDIFEMFNYIECAEYSYSEIKSRWLHRFYMRLSEIAVKYQVPVYIIGGAGDTIWLDKFDTEYPGVSIVCQSSVNLMLNSNHRIENPVVSSVWGASQGYVLIRNKIKKTLLDNDTEIVLNDINASSNRHQLLMKNTNFFWPDGIHPNILGHQIIFDFIKPQIPELVE